MINRVLLLNRVPVTWRTYRFLSNTRKTILVTINDKTGVTTLTFKNPPVNSIDFDLLTEFGEVLTHLEQEKSRGLIITSGIPNVFLAGLDLFEFYKPDKKRLETFWRTLENTWLKLYTSSFPTVALINGHSPGGGCVLSTSCEYRVILGKHYKIGLNEASVGLIPPFWFMDTMRNAIGYRQAEISFSTGTLHPASDALSIGLVDFVTDDEVQAFEKINEFFSKQHKVDAYTRAIMKKEFRQDMVEKFERKREEYIQCMGAEVLAPETQIKLEGYLNAMKKKVEQK